ncbi:MAG: hypothetical protein KHX75_04645, partial [Lachnospiraceae bacterium]|nr:hypothetical protein [Lachnospiraceae bacterium]
TSALLCIKIFFFPFSRTDSQTPNLSQYVLLISHIFHKICGAAFCLRRAAYQHIFFIKGLS